MRWILRLYLDTHPVLSLISKARVKRRTGPNWLNRPFPSSPVPLFQNESECETFLMKIALICIKMNLQAEHIYI